MQIDSESNVYDELKQLAGDTIVNSETKPEIKSDPIYHCLYCKAIYRSRGVLLQHFKKCKYALAQLPNETYESACELALQNADNRFYCKFCRCTVSYPTISRLKQHYNLCVFKKNFEKEKKKIAEKEQEELRKIENEKLENLQEKNNNIKDIEKNIDIKDELLKEIQRLNDKNTKLVKQYEQLKRGFTRQYEHEDLVTFFIRVCSSLTTLKETDPNCYDILQRNYKIIFNVVTRLFEKVLHNDI